MALVLAVVVIFAWFQSFASTRLTDIDVIEREGSARIDDGYSFLVRGSLSVPLSPGVSSELDLELSNASQDPFVVREIDVTVTRVTAPNATELLPCSPADFVVRPWSSELRLDAGQTMTLSALGEGRSSWPQVEMLDTDVNQDGCKGASLSLTYRAVAEPER